jgi:hypothetical protein
MKYTALLLLGLALLPHAVQADQTPVSVCVEALEQLETLQTAAPVYKLTRGQERQYLADADRPAEVARRCSAGVRRMPKGRGQACKPPNDY